MIEYASFKQIALMHRLKKAYGLKIELATYLYENKPSCAIPLVEYTSMYIPFVFEEYIIYRKKETRMNKLRLIFEATVDNNK
jgi:hypothetical protein